MAEAVDIKKQIIDDMLETLKEQVSRYKNLINSNDVTLDQLKDFDNQISEIYDTLQKVSNTQLTLLVSEIEDYKTQFQTKLSEFENILNNIDISNLTLTPEQIESLKGDNGLSAYQIAVNEGFEGTELKWLESLKGKDFAFENMTQVQKDDLLNHFLSSSEITSILQRLDNLENNQGSSTPPSSGNIDPNGTYENGSFIYEDEDLLINEKYFGLTFDYALDDEIEMELTNSSNELFTIKLRVSQDPSYGHYYLDNLSTTPNYEISPLYNFMNDEYGKSLAFGLDVYEFNPSLGYPVPATPFKKYKITLIKNSEVYNLSDVAILSESEFENLQQSQVVM